MPAAVLPTAVLPGAPAVLSSLIQQGRADLIQMTTFKKKMTILSTISNAKNIRTLENVKEKNNLNSRGCCGYEQGSRDLASFLAHGRKANARGTVHTPLGGTLFKITGWPFIYGYRMTI